MISGNRYRLQAEINRETALSKQIATLQVQTSTGVRIQAASDDPAAAARIAVIGQSQADTTAYQANVNAAKAIAATADTTLSSLSNTMQQAQELMLQGASDTLSTSDRAALAQQLRDLATTVANYAATTDSNGNPVFATGSATQIPIGKGLTAAGAGSADEVFGSVQTAGGTASLTDILNAAATALESGDSSAISTSTDAIQAAVDHVADEQALQGTRETRLNAQADRLTAAATSLTSERSDLESTDLTTALATLSAKQTTLEAAQAVLAQLTKSSLFDKIG